MDGQKIFKVVTSYGDDIERRANVILETDIVRHEI